MKVPLGLGDLARALRAIGGDDARDAAVAEVLGFALGVSKPTPPPEPSRTSPSGDPGTVSEPSRPSAPAPAPRPASDRLVLRELERVPPTVTWSRQGDTLGASRPYDAPEPDPLEDPRRLRALLVAALATPSATGPVDGDAAVARIAAGRVLDPVPRHPEGTLRRGAQVLVDQGLAMTPWLADQRRLVRGLVVTLGDARVQEQAFADCPRRGVRDRRTGRLGPWRPPVSGTPVLVLSALGVGSGPGAPREEWLAFARAARAVGCPVVAFVPYGPERWPRALASAMALVHWERGTGAGAIAAARRGAS